MWKGEDVSLRDLWEDGESWDLGGEGLLPLEEVDVVFGVEFTEFLVCC